LLSCYYYYYHHQPPSMAARLPMDKVQREWHQAAQQIKLARAHLANAHRLALRLSKIQSALREVAAAEKETLQTELREVAAEHKEEMRWVHLHQQTGEDAAHTAQKMEDAEMPPLLKQETSDDASSDDPSSDDPSSDEVTDERMPGTVPDEVTDEQMPG
jgi:hypothetical protein